MSEFGDMFVAPTNSDNKTVAIVCLSDLKKRLK